MLSPSVAIIAHFDPDGVFDHNFRLLLTCVACCVDRIVIVTTGDVQEELAADPEKITIIHRPNIGYDFYSYKVGMFEALRRYPRLRQVILLNSSFLILDEHRFSAALARATKRAERYDVVGATSCGQFGWHIQSYFMVLGERIVQSPWCERFFRHVNPRNSKLEVIVDFEVGFSQALRGNGFTTAVLFKPGAFVSLRAKCWWLVRVAKSRGGVGQILRGPIAVMCQTNFVHFAAAEIASQLGFVKTEVLRDNPHRLGRRYIDAVIASGDRAGIAAQIDAKKAHYARSPNGLAVLTSQPKPLPNFTNVTLGAQGWEGIRLAVVIHIYYSDLIPEFIARLRAIPEPFDLFVTTPCEGDLPSIFEQFSAIAASVTVHLSENRGRDIGPFIALLRTGQLSRYLAVLKLHTKKSLYSENGALWRNRLYANLLRDMSMVKRIIGLFETGSVGIVGAEEYYLSEQRFWGANKPTVQRLLHAMGLAGQEDEPKLGFFAGSMFWFAPQAFQPFVDVHEWHLAFEPENGAQDGTLAHAIERLFSTVARSRGFGSTSVKLAGREIETTETSRNGVPVL